MAKQLAAFGVEKGRNIAAVVDELTGKGLLGIEGFTQIRNRDESDLPIFFRNIETDLTIPAYGCVQVVGTEEFEGRTYAQVKQPVDTDGTAGCYIFNTLQEVAPNEFGMGSAGPWVRVRSEIAEPDAGDHYGPKVGSFDVQEGGTLLCAAGRDHIFPMRDSRKIALMQVQAQGGGGANDMQAIAFDTSGYCDGPPDAQVFWVSITRNNNSSAPAEPPSEAVNFPANATLVYQGFSHDTYPPGGQAYNTHLYVYQVCDPSFDLAAFLDSTVISDWVAELNTLIPPNEQWLDRLGAPVSPTYDAVKDVIDDELAQPATYRTVDVLPLSLFVDDCDVNLCSDRDPSLNVIGREIRVKVTERSCGVTRAHEEDDEGYVIVRDTTGSFLYGRKASEINCRRGVALWMHTPGEYKCHWLIIWMDMFDEIQVVHDIVIGTQGIEIERKRIDVWRECDLPDEYIEGDTCEGS